MKRLSALPLVLTAMLAVAAVPPFALASADNGPRVSDFYTQGDVHGRGVHHFSACAYAYTATRATIRFGRRTVVARETARGSDAFCAHFSDRTGTTSTRATFRVTVSNRHGSTTSTFKHFLISGQEWSVQL